MWEVFQGIGVVLSVALPTWGLITCLLRRSRFPKNELWYELTSMRVLNVQGSGVELFIDRKPLKEPFRTTLHVWSTGTADMPTAAFDNAVPITFTLDRPMLGKVKATETPGSNIDTEVVGDRRLLLGPGLVRKDYRGSWSFITEGIATIQDAHALFGATLQSAAQAERSSSRRETVGRLLLVLTFGSLAAMVVGGVVSSTSPEVREFMTSWVAIGFLIIGFGFGGLIAISSVPTRWDRAQRKRGASRFGKYNGDPFNPQERYHST
jgi:hypothetical protein